MHSTLRPFHTSSPLTKKPERPLTERRGRLRARGEKRRPRRSGVGLPCYPPTLEALPHVSPLRPRALPQRRHSLGESQHRLGELMQEPLRAPHQRGCTGILPKERLADPGAAVRVHPTAVDRHAQPRDQGNDSRDLAMSDRPDPLVPPEVDLRSFRFMPLDVLRLRDSDLSAVASGDQFKAAVMLWCAAWHQVPAGSVPNDERWLARHSGAGANWPAVRTEALRGFVECSDGRLYHEVVAEKALESWQYRVAQRERTRLATLARTQRNDQRDGGNSQRNVTNSPRNVHQGIGTEQTKDFKACAYENCKATGSKSRSTNGSGKWYCPAHFEAVFYPAFQTAEAKGKFDD